MQVNLKGLDTKENNIKAGFYALIFLLIGLTTGLIVLVMGIL